MRLMPLSPLVAIEKVMSRKYEDLKRKHAESKNAKEEVPTAKKPAQTQSEPVVNGTPATAREASAVVANGGFRNSLYHQNSLA